MLDRESSLRRLAIEQRHRLPETVDWQGLRLHERRLVRTHGGIAYLNAAEYSAGTGGLYVPLAPQLPILCSDPSLRETWLAQAENALSMQPVPTTVEAAGAGLRQALLEAGGDHHRTQQACRRACDAVEQRLDESDRDCRDRRMALLADTARETSRALALTAADAMRAAVQRFIDRSMPPL